MTEEEKKEKKRAHDKAYRESHKEEKRASDAEYRRTHKKELAAYRAVNKDKIAAGKVAWRKKNKEAIAAYEADYRAKNKASIVKWKADYRAENKDEISAYNAEYYSENAERIKAEHLIYNAENKDKIAAYYQEHKEEKAIYGAEWYKNNKDIRKAWVADNRDKRNAYNAKRRAIFANATIGDLDEIAEIYRQAQEDEGIICYLCGKVIELGDRNVDHVHPISKGGKHTPPNLRITHVHCNFVKHDTILEPILLNPGDRVIDREGDIGTVVYSDDPHNVQVHYDNGGSSINCIVPECESFEGLWLEEEQ